MLDIKIFFILRKNYFSSKNIRNLNKTFIFYKYEYKVNFMTPKIAKIKRFFKPPLAFLTFHQFT